MEHITTSKNTKDSLVIPKKKRKKSRKIMFQFALCVRVSPIFPECFPFQIGLPMLHREADRITKKKQVLAIHRRVYESFCPFRSMSSLRRPWKTNADRPRRHRTMPEKIIRIKQKRSCDINKQGGVSSREIPSPRNHACGQAVRCAKLTIIFCFP